MEGGEETPCHIIKRVKMPLLPNTIGCDCGTCTCDCGTCTWVGNPSEVDRREMWTILKSKY